MGAAIAEYGAGSRAVEEVEALQAASSR